VISVLRREADENYTLLGYYTAFSGNSLPTFLNKVKVAFLYNRLHYLADVKGKVTPLQARSGPEGG
jgi:hypothetical protein